MAKRIYQYYVEGDDEKALVNTLKSDLRCIESGKVEVFNVVQNLLKQARLRTLKPNTIVVLVYDTDTYNVATLQANIRLLKKHPAVKEVYCIPQVMNLEDVLIQSCQINKAHELTHSRTKTDFKRDIIRCSNLGHRLTDCRFDTSKLWNKEPPNEFNQFGNDSDKIKLK